MVCQGPGQGKNCAPLALGAMKMQTLLLSLLWICLVSRWVYQILILNTILNNIFFPLGKMIGMVRSRNNFILLSRFWEIGSPPRGSAGRMKFFCVMPASVMHIWPIYISWRTILHLSVFWQFDKFWTSVIILLKKKGRIHPTLILLHIKKCPFFNKF